MSVGTTVDLKVVCVYQASNALQIKESLQALLSFLGLGVEAKVSPDCEERLGHFLQHHYESFAFRLFEEICPKWLPCFTLHESSYMFDIFFDSSLPATHVFVALAGSIPACITKYAIENIFRLCHNFVFRQRRFIEIFSPDRISSTSKIPAIGNQVLLNLVGGLPDRFANLSPLHSSFLSDPAFSPEQFFTVLLDQALGALFATPEPIVAIPALHLGLVAKLARRRLCGPLLEVLLPHLLFHLRRARALRSLPNRKFNRAHCHRSPAPFAAVNVRTLLFQLPPDAMEAVFEELLTKLDEPTNSSATMSSTANSTTTIATHTTDFSSTTTSGSCTEFARELLRFLLRQALVGACGGKRKKAITSASNTSKNTEGVGRTHVKYAETNRACSDDDDDDDDDDEDHDATATGAGISPTSLHSEPFKVASEHAAFLFLDKFFTVRVFPRKIRHALSTLAWDCGPKVHGALMTRLGSVWSSEPFLRHAPQPQQEYITQALLDGLACLASLITDPSADEKLARSSSTNPATSDPQYLSPRDAQRMKVAQSELMGLLQGVSRRLSAGVRETRNHGLLVAEAFAYLLEPSSSSSSANQDGPLRFDETVRDPAETLALGKSLHARFFPRFSPAQARRVLDLPEDLSSLPDHPDFAGPLAKEALSLASLDKGDDELPVHTRGLTHLQRKHAAHLQRTSERKRTRGSSARATEEKTQIPREQNVAGRQNDRENGVNGRHVRFALPPQDSGSEADDGSEGLERSGVSDDSFSDDEDDDEICEALRDDAEVRELRALLASEVDEAFVNPSFAFKAFVKENIRFPGDFSREDNSNNLSIILPSTDHGAGQVNDTLTTPITNSNSNNSNSNPLPAFPALAIDPAQDRSSNGSQPERVSAFSQHVRAFVQARTDLVRDQPENTAWPIREPANATGEKHTGDTLKFNLDNGPEPFPLHNPDIFSNGYVDPDATWTEGGNAEVAWAWPEPSELAENENELETEADATPFVPYALPTEDFSHLDKVPAPTYLSEALDYLKSTKDTETDKVDAAISALEGLVRTPSPELFEAAAPLTKLVIYAAPADPEVAAARERALVALAACAPLQTVPVLSQRLHAHEAVANRLLALRALVHAANELAGNSSTPQQAGPALAHPSRSLNNSLFLPEAGSEAKLGAPALATSEAQTIRSVAPGQSQSEIVPGSEAARALSPRARHALVQQRVEANTRRWGSQTRPGDETHISGQPAVNRFSPFAPLFFQAILTPLEIIHPNLLSSSTSLPSYRIIDREQHTRSPERFQLQLPSPTQKFHGNTNITHMGAGGGLMALLREEPGVLSELLCALSAVVKCNRHGPSGPSLAKALIDAAFATRFHTEPAVRRASLFALHAVLASLPAPVLAASLADELRESVEWLSGLRAHEPDATTRELGVVCLRSLVAVLEEVEKSGGSGGRELRQRGLQGLRSYSDMRAGSQTEIRMSDLRVMHS